MSVETLKTALPDYAKDIALNLSTLARGSSLSDVQHWGALVAAAAATRNETVLREIHAEAAEHLSDVELKAALGAATIMAMNNVYYRSRHMLGVDYAQMRPSLRQNIIGSSGGVDATSFELWAVVAAAVNNCEQCLKSHEVVLRQAGMTAEQIHDGLRIAGVVVATAQAVMVVDSLS